MTNDNYDEVIPDPTEYEDARRKLEFLAGRHGQGYTFSQGPHHTVKYDPEDGLNFGDNDIVMHAPNGDWAGSITHSDDGNVGHFYVEKAHRAAVPALLTEAVRQAKELGFIPPHAGGSMSPKAYKMASRILPRNTAYTGGNPRGDVVTRYGD
jgi:hypothetical protein